MTPKVFKQLFIALSTIALVAVACDTDYNTIGSDILEDDIHHNNIEKYTASTIAFDRATGAVQSNNLPIKALGVLDNPVFGKTVAHVVTQLELASPNPTFHSPVIDSVYLYVPYFSTYKSLGTDGETKIYELDSITGNPDAKINLSIYRNGYFLRDNDPAAAGAQKYYSNERPMVEGAIASGRLNDGPAADNDQFQFKNTEVQRSYVNNAGETVIKDRLAPGMFMYLNKPFFQQTILDHPEKLVNNNIFKEYMRGLYFKVEQVADESVMAMLRFSDGYIRIAFKETLVDTEGNPLLDENGQVRRVSNNLTLNLKTNTINFFDNTPNTNYQNALIGSDELNGDDKLFVKGGDGSVAFLDLLSDADIAYLKSLREPVSKQLLINEANLVFYVDNESSVGMNQISSANSNREMYDPLRLYLYDVKNSIPLTDYYFDTTTYTPNPKLNKYIHGGRAVTDENKRATQYKIRLTNYISDIVNNDSINRRLGLAVTETIAVVGNAALKNPVGSGATAFKVVPVSSVMGQRGTVLYGSNAAVPEAKRLKLEIYYTKPN
ncbi:hypothetical protein VF13_37350 [Nostoc linckia z16]|nr:hypothetical protein VF13_37350 [Nostoc linckia z16]